MEVGAIKAKAIGLSDHVEGGCGAAAIRPRAWRPGLTKILLAGHN